jgi:hypothetical protein
MRYDRVARNRSADFQAREVVGDQEIGMKYPNAPSLRRFTDWIETKGGT